MEIETTPYHEIDYLKLEPQEVRAMSVVDYKRLLDELEDNNWHSEYVLLEALRVGDCIQIEEGRAIVRDHDRVGRLSEETSTRRYKLLKELNQIVDVRETKPETPGSSMFGVRTYNPLEVGVKGWPLMVSAADYNRVASSLADALSLALQHVPLDSEDERQIIALEKAATLGHIPNGAAREGSHTFELHISGCSYDQALQVLTERLGHDEDYGFPYTLNW